MQHWIFDLDGTLVNSFPAYIKVVTEVLQGLGISLTAEDQDEIRHHLPKDFLARFLRAEQVDSAFQQIIATSLTRQSEVPVYEGAQELLLFLRSKNCTLSLFTARDRVTALAILEFTGLNTHFSKIITRDCVTNCKPHPDGILHLLSEAQTHATTTVMIGDHATDMEAAKSAGVKGISVSWDETPSRARELSDLHFTRLEDLHAWAIAQLP